MFDHDFKARKRIDELEEALSKLTRDFHKLEMDWADTLDKVKRMMMRIAKRAEVAEAAEREEEETVEEVPADGSSLPIIARGLRGRARAINEAILNRRRR